MELSRAQISNFQAAVWRNYGQHGRQELPWRKPEASGRFDPYKILVSELMLQQTQVSRVIPKYYEFLQRFPNAETLAQAPLGEVLEAWSGLGYNRRAKYLHQAAQMVVRDWAGAFPQTITELVKLPGVGSNTAGAVLAYAFNQPVVFVETNIRTVFIYHFFSGQADVTDSAISKVVAQVLPIAQTKIKFKLRHNAEETSPRDFYWALMDYGSYLKQTIGNVSRQSKHYVKQPAFQGSRRQLRGSVLRLLAGQRLSERQLQRETADSRLPEVLKMLLQEGLIQRTKGRYHL